MGRELKRVPLDFQWPENKVWDGYLNPHYATTYTEGQRGTYGCACLDRDSVQCAAIRYGMDHYGEACTCLCHQWSDDDDEYQ